MTKESYLHGFHPSVLSSHLWRDAKNSAAYLLPHIDPSAKILDVGCGPGTITADLARLSTNEIIGIDQDGAVIKKAQEDFKKQGLSNLKFQVGQVYELDFADQSFDIVHAHQVLQHLVNPIKALQEMKRVCKSQGIVAVRDVDYAMMTWYPGNPLLGEFLDKYHQVAFSLGAQPDAGRRLLAWANKVGFSSIEPLASTWCFATERDRQWWGQLWSKRITDSNLAKQLLDKNLATPQELNQYSQAWLEWANNSDGWTVLVHGEILCRV